MDETDDERVETQSDDSDDDTLVLSSDEDIRELQPNMTELFITEKQEGRDAWDSNDNDISASSQETLTTESDTETITYTTEDVRSTVTVKICQATSSGDNKSYDRLSQDTEISDSDNSMDSSSDSDEEPLKHNTPLSRSIVSFPTFNNLTDVATSRINPEVASHKLHQLLKEKPKSTSALPQPLKRILNQIGRGHSADSVFNPSTGRKLVLIKDRKQLSKLLALFREEVSDFYHSLSCIKVTVSKCLKPDHP